MGLSDVVRTALFDVSEVSSIPDLTKKIEADPTRLEDAYRILCKDAKKELETERRRENRMESAHEISLYLTLILLVITTALILLGRITEPIGSGAIAIMTGTGATFYWKRLKDQRQLLKQKINAVQRYCAGHRLIRGMLYANVPSRKIVGALASDASMISDE